MISTRQFQARRQALFDTIKRPILLCANGHRARNFPMNRLPFRQDSSFLYYTGCTEPNAAVWIDEDQHQIFLESAPDGDSLWHGQTPSVPERGRHLGFERTSTAQLLPDFIQNQKGWVTIAVPDEQVNQWLSSQCQKPLQCGKYNGDDVLINAIVEQRRILDNSELDSMRYAQQITAESHINAMKATHPGANERDIAAAFFGPGLRSGLPQAYQPIVTVDGHILHNHRYQNTLMAGQLMLLDGGVESPNGYATDVTRTWPVSGEWSQQQRECYEAVLEAQTRAIALLAPGRRYREVHTEASLAIAEFLSSVGLLNCTPETAVETGAHALFFPHGVGHLIGLDVHDLENFGDCAAYAPGRTRSDQFGTGYLRLDLDLEVNMVVTVEPGFYIVPEILNLPKFRQQFKDEIRWNKLSSWWGFGGIRIEDDVRITDGTPEILSFATPKSPDEILTLIGSS